jgi:hypothetical protein
MIPKTHTIDGVRWIRKRALEKELEAWRAFQSRTTHQPAVRLAADIFEGYLKSMSDAVLDIDGVEYVQAIYWSTPDQMWVRRTLGRGRYADNATLERWRRRVLMVFELTHQDYERTVPVGEREWVPAKMSREDDR